MTIDQLGPATSKFVLCHTDLRDTDYAAKTKPKRIANRTQSRRRNLVLRAVDVAATILALAVLLAVSHPAYAQTGYAFPAAVNVGASSAPQAVSVKITTAGTLATIKALTVGAPNLDFSAAAGSCTTIAYSVGQSCTVSVTMAAKAPGIRSGAVQLLDGNGIVLGTEFLFGVGVGPLSVFNSGQINSVAGNGQLGAGPTIGTVAVDAVIDEPVGVAVDGAGNFYYTDSGDNLIGKVDHSGNLTIIAGTGTAGFSPDGTVATSAQLSSPSAIVIDGAGNIVFTEFGNSTVREIVSATGLIETLAGTGTIGYSGDGGAATAATLSHPEGLAFDSANNLYIADTYNNVIRKVSSLDGTISTIAGNGSEGFGGDGGPAAGGIFDQPEGIAFGTDGSLYIADFKNYRVRRINGSGTLNTVAGTGTSGYSGDGGAAIAAALDHPASVAVDAAGDVFFSDSDNNVIRKINGASHLIDTVAGNGAAASSGDGVDANNGSVDLNKPYGVTLDAGGDLFIADRLGLKIREVTGNIAFLGYKDIKATNTSAPLPQEIDNEGNAALHISAITPVTNAVIDSASTTCSTTAALAIGGGCVAGIDFKPATVGSPATGTVTIASDSVTSPITIDLSGNALSIEPTTTTVTSSANPSADGAAVTFTATVSSLSTTLTGTVSFMDGATLLGGTAVLLNSTTRQAIYTTSSLGLGSHSITAVYSGDSADQTSTSSPALVQVVKQTASLNLTSGLNPAHVYDPITFTVTASALPSGGATPTGSIVFSVDGSLLPNGTIGLSSGVASYTTSLLSAGSHTITASYTGDTNTLAGNSNALTQVVNVAPTTTTLTTSNASVLLTTPVTFTATVAGVSTSIPTGSVVFKDGANVIGSGAVNSAGTATLTYASLTTGSHSITAVYSGDTDYAGSTSAALTQAIQKVNTGVTIAANANPANSGAIVVFSVTVTGSNSTTPNIPVTGTVNVTEGATLLGSGTLASAGSGPASSTVSISVASFAPGPHAITVTYVGDTNYASSTNGMLETVNLATSSVALSASPATTIATKPMTLIAHVSSTGGVPTGTVQFLDGTVVLGTGGLSNGAASYTTATLSVGTHMITAAYLGDPKDGASTSAPFAVVVKAATTAVTVAPSQNPSNFGQPLTLNISVTGNGAVPGGSVTIYDGTAALQSTALNSNGFTSFTTSSLGDGPHTLTVVYSGDANDLPSTSAPLTVNVLQTVTLTLSSPSPNPSIARSNVHFVATISALQGIQPTGSISFVMDGTKALGAGLISGSTATLDTTAIPVGTHTIVASYSGSSTTQALNSPAYTQVVNAAGVSVAVVSNANPATYGALLTFTATASSTAGPLTGTVDFKDGGTTIGSAALSSTGVATFTTSTLGTGSHNIVAAYLGDSNDLPASSSTLVQVVQRATSITLSPSQNPLLTLAPLVLSAAVDNGGGPAPTGTITFTQDKVVLATVPVSASGTATYSIASLPAGTHTFLATYSGDAVDIGSSSIPMNELVQLRATADVLTTSASSLTGGQQLTLISVLHWTGPVTPTGTVTFSSGTYTLATVPVDPTGVATVTVLLSGTSASLNASYSGDTDYTASLSPTTLVTIGAAPDFTMAATPPSFTLASQQMKNLTVTIGSVKNFTDTLSLGCLGLPQGATCIYSQDQMVLSAGSLQTVTLTVDTGNPLLAGETAKNQTPLASKLVTACFLPGGLLLGLLGYRFRRQRGLGGMLLVLALASLSTALSGCGGITQKGTPVGVYNFNISAVGRTGVSETIPVTMTVTQ
jgi:hypothetical protein